MSNETKRDVFDAVLTYVPVGREYDPVNEDDAGDLRSCLSARYNAALPDNIPVIPKDVSEWLTWCKMSNHSLKDALDGETRVSEETFARAWLLGVWSVEETGEIVKLEEYK